MLSTVTSAPTRRAGVTRRRVSGGRVEVCDRRLRSSACLRRVGHQGALGQEHEQHEEGHGDAPAPVDGARGYEEARRRTPTRPPGPWRDDRRLWHRPAPPARHRLYGSHPLPLPPLHAGYTHGLSPTPPAPPRLDGCQAQRQPRDACGHAPAHITEVMDPQRETTEAEYGIRVPSARAPLHPGRYAPGDGHETRTMFVPDPS